MSAATIVSEAYGEGACLYETVLGVPKDASPSQLRKAYYKKCLRHHPDKLSSDLSNDERESAKKKFQAISLAYTILSDEEKRREYDDSGDLYEDDDDLASGKSGMKQWMDYFNSVFPKVTKADIDAFEVKYKCSDDEEQDVLKYYTQFKGDLNKMLECVMLSSDVDKQRWVKDYIEPAIGRGDVSDHAAKIKKTLGSAPAKKRKSKGGGRKKVKEARVEEESEGSDSSTPEAEIVDDDEDMEEDETAMGAKENNHNKSKKKSNSNASAKKKPSSSKAPKSSKKAKSSVPDDDLIAQIRGNAVARRQEGFDSLMAGLEDRYGGGGGKKKKGQKKQSDDDIDDDEFAKIQANLMQNKKSRKRG
ncbi:hypothetical protein ACHAWF_014672 [Thalassiosira exigua]